MGKTTQIAWCKSSWNGWIGCTRVSEGCNSCYAEALDKRMRFAGATHWGPGVPRHRTSESNWRAPLIWNKQAPDTEFAGRKGFWPVFCASLADVFDNEVPHQWRMDLWDLVEATPNLTWYIVTKRIGNAHLMVRPYWMRDTFPPNVRIIATIVNQEEADRDIPKLLDLPCKNGISYEPALSGVDWRPWLAHQYQGGHDTGGAASDPCSVCGVFTNGLHHPYARGVEWIIVGGESKQAGHEARPFSEIWARRTIEQCHAAAVPVFMKQMGSVVQGPVMSDRIEDPITETFRVGYTKDGRRVPYGPIYKDRAGADPDEWPKDLRIREFPL